MRVATSPAQSSVLALAFGDGRTRIPRTLVQRVLWGDANSRTVRHRASQLVYQTNQRCEARVLKAEGEFVRVRRDVVACDMTAFDEMVAARRFGKACDLLERGFLAAFPRWRGNALAEWIEERRVGVRARLRSASMATWQAAEAAQDWAAAREAAEALLRIDPRDELMLRRVMRAQAMGGRVREAEAVYRAFADRSRDWSPEPETRRLLLSVRGRAGTEWGRSPGGTRPARGGARAGSDEAARAGDAGASQGPEDLPRGNAGRLPFRGRDDVLGRINRILYGGGVATISGESGIGKTRLAEVAVRGAELLGLDVIRARPEPVDRRVRLSTLAKALDQAWIRRRVGRNERTSLLPPPGGPSGAAEAFRRLCEALARLRGFVLFVDDFHHADEESATVLHSVCEEADELPFSLLLAYRGEALHHASATARFVRAQEADSRTTHVRLRGLDDAAAREVAAAARRTAPGKDGHVAGDRARGDAMLDLVVRLGGGNPRFLAALAQEGRGGQADGKDGGGEAGRPALQLRTPELVRRFVRERMEAAGEVGRKVAAGLAVFGAPAGLGAVARLSACTPGECVDAVERLERAGILSWNSGKAPFRISFRHGVVRQAVYEATTPVRRAFAHGVAASLLLSGPSPPALDHAARHCHLAGDRNRARRYGLLAAAATPRTKVAARLALLEIARQASDGADRRTLSVRLAREHWAALRVGEALRLGDDALASGRPATAAGAACSGAPNLGEAAPAPGKPATAAQHRAPGIGDTPRGGGEDMPGPDQRTPAANAGAVDKASGRAAALSTQTLDIRLLVATARRELGLESPRTLLGVLDGLESAALANGSELSLVRVLDARLLALLGHEDASAVEDLLRRAAELAERLADERARCRCLSLLAAGGAYRPPGAALQAARAAWALAKSDSLRGERAFAGVRYAAALAATGLLQTPEGRATVEQARADASEAGDLRARAELSLQLAEWHAGAGDHLAGESALKEARLVMAEPAHCPPLQTRAALADAGLALARGDLAAAARAVASTRELGETGADRRRERRLAGLEGEVLLQSGKLRRATDLAAQHPPGSAQHAPPDLLLLHARLLARTGRVGGAIALLDRGLGELAEVRNLAWLRIALELARLSRRARSPRPALAKTAEDRARKLNIAGLADQLGPFTR